MIYRSRNALENAELSDALENVKRHDFNGTVIRSVYMCGQTWVVFSDVCKALGYKNPSSEHKRVSDDQKRHIDIGLKNALAVCVNLDGLKRYAALSSKPVAVEFQRWTAEEFRKGACRP